MGFSLLVSPATPLAAGREIQGGGQLSPQGGAGHRQHGSAANGAGSRLTGAGAWRISRTNPAAGMDRDSRATPRDALASARQEIMAREAGNPLGPRHAPTGSARPSPCSPFPWPSPPRTATGTASRRKGSGYAASPAAAWTGWRPWRKSAALWAWAAALTMKRLSSFSTFSQLAM